jgi:hypothetical protein
VDSIPTVRRMLRNLSHGFARSACPGCGRAVLDSEAVQFHGQRFHRRCAFYSTRRSATGQEIDGTSV